MNYQRIDDMGPPFQPATPEEMSDRAFLVTTTGEPFQPSRLHYTVRDHGYAVRIVEQRDSLSGFWSDSLSTS
jgi:hypothetical protein